MQAAAPDVSGQKRLEELQERYGLTEGQSNSVNEKSQIVTFSWEDPQEKKAFAEVNERIASLEASVDELGSHFVKYQQDFVSIIVQECARLTQHINEQGLKIQNQAQVQVHESLSRAQAELWSKMTTEWTSTKCNEKLITLDTSQDTISTACGGKELEEHGELMRVMDGLRKDIDGARNRLGARADATEKRLADLEEAMAVQLKTARGSLLSGELDVSERRWASRVKASETFRAMLQPANAVEKSKPCEPSSTFGTRKVASDMSKMLDGLVASVQRGALAPGSAPASHSGSVEADCREIGQSVLRKASGSISIPLSQGKPMRTSTSVSVGFRTALESPRPSSTSRVPAPAPRASRSVSPQPSAVPLRSALQMSGFVRRVPLVVSGAFSYTAVSSTPSRPTEDIQKTAAPDKIVIS